MENLNEVFYRFRKTGTFHERIGTEYEDCSIVTKCGSDGFIAIVADGMGGMENGGDAAKIAVNQAATVAKSVLIVSQPWTYRAAVGAAMSESISALNHASRESGRPLESYGTTLMCVVGRLSTGDVAWGYVGDGVLAGRRDGEVFLLSQPQRYGDHATNGVLTGKAIEFGEESALDGLAVCTDGIGDALLTENDCLAEDSKMILVPPPETAFSDHGRALDELLSRHQDEASPFADVTDDMTMVLINFPKTGTPPLKGEPLQESPDPETPKHTWRCSNKNNARRSKHARGREPVVHKRKNKRQAG